MIRRTFFPFANWRKPSNINIGKQRRCINHCLHIKGVPVHLSKDDIYTFFTENYGRIKEFASYPEAPNKSTKDDDVLEMRKRNFISHDRPPGQTVIIRFDSLNSAVMCKDELHWRPFPSRDYKVTEDIVMTSPRDRPLVNILYETNTLHEKMRGWVVRDLKLSRGWIREKDDVQFHDLEPTK